MEANELVLVTGGINLLIQALAMFANFKVVDWRLRQLESRVLIHDEFAERLTRVEIKVTHLESSR